MSLNCVEPIDLYRLLVLPLCLVLQEIHEDTPQRYEIEIKNRGSFGTGKIESLLDNLGSEKFPANDSLIFTISCMRRYFLMTNIYAQNSIRLFSFRANSGSS